MVCTFIEYIPGTFAPGFQSPSALPHPEDVRYITVDDSHSFKEKMEIPSSGEGWVAHERWNWKMSPIIAATDTSRDSRVRYL
jgi:hypothetical protein